MKTQRMFFFTMYDNSQIRIVLLLKLNQLKREELPTLSYQNLVDYLFSVRWRNAIPETLNDITTDIMAIKAEEVVSYLSVQAIVDSKKHSLSDFDDLYEVRDHYPGSKR